MRKKEISEQIISGFSIGVTVGVFISLFVNAVLKTEYYSPATPALLNHFSSNWASFINVICYGAIGVVSTIASKIFKIEKLSFKIKTLLHFLSIEAMVFIVGLLLGWVKYYFLFVPISVVVYLMFYLFSYFHRKKEVKILNEALGKKK